MGNLPSNSKDRLAVLFYNRGPELDFHAGSGRLGEIMPVDKLTQDELKRLFQESDSLRTGHFRLASGLCSDTLLDKDRLLMDARRVETIGFHLSRAYGDQPVDLVIAANSGSLTKVADAMIRKHLLPLKTTRLSMHAEKCETGLRGSFRRFLAEQSTPLRTVLLEDVLTTGGSIQKLLWQLADYASNLEIIGVIAIASRVPVADIVLQLERDDSGPTLQPEALVELNLSHWNQETCPHCQANEPHTAGFGQYKHLTIATS